MREKKPKFKFTTADIITITRLLFAPVVIPLFLLGYNYLSAGFYYLAALTDALDGYVARKYKQVTSHGSYLDALIDRLFLIAIFITLALTGVLKSWIIYTFILFAIIELNIGYVISKKTKKHYLYFIHRNSIRYFAVLIYLVFGLYLMKFIYADYVFVAAAFLGIISIFDYIFYIKKL